MIRSPKIRLAARLSLAAGSIMAITGGILMFVGISKLGDGLMIAGLIIFCIGAGVLAATPTGDTDAR